MQSNRKRLMWILVSASLILAAVFIRAMNPPKQHLYRTEVLSNAKQLSISALMYASDNDGKMPALPSKISKRLTSMNITPNGFPYLSQVRERGAIEIALMPYIKNEKLFGTGLEIPITTDRFEHGDVSWHKFAGSDYGWNDYNLLKGYNVDKEKDTATCVLLYQMEPFEDKLRVISYMDAHAKMHPPEAATKSFSRHPYWFLP